MRTDSTALSDTAVRAARSQVSSRFGSEYLSSSPGKWEGKVKNAQEAHEAIRPAGDTFRAPAEVRTELNQLEHRLYELIWMRTLASQMAEARGKTVTVRLGATSSAGRDTEFGAAGTTITFPGYRRAYVEGTDDETVSPSAEDERILPPLAVGDVVPLRDLEPSGHTTSAPARYTEASLVKKLEDLGIGRPSTWANIIQTVLDRGYLWKKGQSLVPTWTAFAVVNLMERHFDDLVDYAFTARLEDDLDAIARNEVRKEAWLRNFYFGDEELPGLKRLVEENLDEIDAAEINTFPIGVDADGNLVVVKPGRYGPYVKRGDDTASVPDDLAPDELTVEKAIELLAAPKGDVPIGMYEDFPVYVKSGRYGPYVQWGDTDAPPPGESKAKMASLLSSQSPQTLTLDDAVLLLSLPRVVGVDPADGHEVVAANGRYGPYVQKDKESRSLSSEGQLFTITLPEALAVLAQPRQFRGRAPAKPPLCEFGADPVSGRPVVAREGRFGIYVTDGESNASIGRGDRIDQMSSERAFELLAIRREQVASKDGGRPVKKGTAKRAGGAKKAGAAKKGGGATNANAVKKATGAKKATAKSNSAAKSAPATKTAGKKATGARKSGPGSAA
jgi:DNA topoisomerase-1